MDYFENSHLPDKLLSFTECYHGNESVAIYRTALGEYRVIHSLPCENIYSGDIEWQEHEGCFQDATEVFNFLLETLGTIYGEPPWYIIEAMEQSGLADGAGG